MRRSAIAALALIAVGGIVTTASAGSTPSPVLSGSAVWTGSGGVAGGLPGSKGFGRVRPGVIYLGGDESGLICGIRWVSWGGQFATGVGTGWYIGSHQGTSQGHQAPVVVVAYHLATWRHRPAYAAFRSYFPQGGSTYGGVGRCGV